MCLWLAGKAWLRDPRSSKTRGRDRPGQVWAEAEDNLTPGHDQQAATEGGRHQQQDIQRGDPAQRHHLKHQVTIFGHSTSQIQQLVQQDDPFRQQLDNLLHKKAAYGASTAKKRDQVKFKTLKSKMKNRRNSVGISYIRLYFWTSLLISVNPVHWVSVKNYQFSR